jgi:hypothetical protein
MTVFDGSHGREASRSNDATRLPFMSDISHALDLVGFIPTGLSRDQRLLFAHVVNVPLSHGSSLVSPL